jgi:hypothetical protein
MPHGRELPYKLKRYFWSTLSVPRMRSRVILIPAVNLPGDQNSYCKKIYRPVRASV